MNDNPSEESPQMPKLTRHRLTVAAATAAALVGGTAVAGAAGGSSSSGTAAQRGADAGGGGERPLTGAVRERVRRAALARVDGTVLRVETDRGGVYEAHIRRADGTEVEVRVDARYAVTAVVAVDGDRRGRGGRGHGPGARADLAAVARTLGVTEARLRAAVRDARPADSRRDRRGELAAALAEALDVEAADVREVLVANRPERGPGGRRGGRLDDGALVTALAQGLSKTETQVRAALEEVQQAHRAEHEERQDAFFAAVARALGKDAADVEAAFEAARPGD